MTDKQKTICSNLRPEKEAVLAIKQQLLEVSPSLCLAKWFKAFPKVKVCIGSHDRLVARKAITHGLPERVVKKFRDIWKLPRGWVTGWYHYIQGVRYEHGNSFGGLYPNVAACKSNRCSTVIGHRHASAGVYWDASDHDIIFGLSVGCGIDRKKYAFWYGREYKRKPILGCGLVTENGKNARFIAMRLGR